MRTVPPIEQGVTVEAPRDRTFEVFTATIGAWWPTATISQGQSRVRAVELEGRAGGRVFERWDDGTTVDWGEILAWDPPERFVMSWTATPAPTEVEVRFLALGPSVTRVQVEHRGWEALSEAQLSEDCAAPGGYRSGAYVQGWAAILERFAAAV